MGPNHLENGSLGWYAVAALTTTACRLSRRAATAAVGVLLCGTVGSLREKREAKWAAQRVYGVKRVENKLEVRFLGDGGRQDLRYRASRAAHTSRSHRPATPRREVCRTRM